MLGFLGTFLTSCFIQYRHANGFHNKNKRNTKYGSPATTETSYSVIALAQTRSTIAFCDVDETLCGQGSTDLQAHRLVWYFFGESPVKHLMYMKSQ